MEWLRFATEMLVIVIVLVSGILRIDRRVTHLEAKVKFLCNQLKEIK